MENDPLMTDNFPIIKHIDDVLEHVTGSHQVSERGNFTIISAKKIGVDPYPEFFDDDSEEERLGKTIQREFRGLKFHTDSGKIAARPFHKFFNIDERKESSAANMRITDDHWFEEKLDGSMIHSAFDGDKVVWMTKNGETDVADMAADYVNRSRSYYGMLYEEFCNTWMRLGYTPIFEYVGPNNRIVLRYPEERLVLLAMRHNETGKYISRIAYTNQCISAGIRLVERYYATANTAIEWTEGMEDGEGFVISWRNGHRLKIKSEWYRGIHSLINILSSDRKVYGIIIDDALDDYMPHLPDDLQASLAAYHKYVFTHIMEAIDQTMRVLRQIKEDKIEGRELYERQLLGEYQVPRELKKLVSKSARCDIMPTESEVYEYAIEALRKIRSGQRVADITMIGDKRWSDFNLQVDNDV